MFLCNENIYARVYGTGYPFLLIHGNHGSGKVFSKMINKLRKHYQLVVPDLPGHGNGPPINTLFDEDPGLAVDYCFKVLDYLGIKEVYVSGHSLGGMIALLMSIAQPQRIKALILLDSYVKYNERPPELTNFFFPGDNETVRNEIEDALNNGPGLSWYKFFDIRSEIDKIRCPVLELFGESNPETTNLFYDWLNEKRMGFPHSWKILRIAGAGHFLQIEQPVVVENAIISFLGMLK